MQFRDSASNLQKCGKPGKLHAEMSASVMLSPTCGQREWNTRLSKCKINLNHKQMKDKKKCLQITQDSCCVTHSALFRFFLRIWAESLRRALQLAAGLACSTWHFCGSTPAATTLPAARLGDLRSQWRS